MPVIQVSTSERIIITENFVVSSTNGQTLMVLLLLTNGHIRRRGGNFPGLAPILIVLRGEKMYRSSTGMQR